MVNEITVQRRMENCIVCRNAATAVRNALKKLALHKKQLRILLNMWHNKLPMLDLFFILPKNFFSDAIQILRMVV